MGTTSDGHRPADMRLINSALVLQCKISDPHILSAYEYHSRLLLYALHLHRVKELQLDWKHTRRKAAPKDKGGIN
jgi:hypothetical protein